MPNSQKYLSRLVDVAALSKRECERPIKTHLVYASRDNFTGQIVDGYTPGLTDFTVMTQDAALALCKVQDDLIQQFNLELLIYDAYRPKRAVKHFMRWSTETIADAHELSRKNIHYPHIEKNQLFDLGYVAEDSQHCYGHTVDLVLVDTKGNELDLGACFDFMDELSHITVSAEALGDEPWHNRQILSKAMIAHGFLPYVKEFWHFSFRNKLISEPVDIVIAPELKGLNVV